MKFIETCLSNFLLCTQWKCMLIVLRILKCRHCNIWFHFWSLLHYELHTQQSIILGICCKFSAAVHRSGHYILGEGSSGSSAGKPSISLLHVYMGSAHRIWVLFLQCLLIKPIRWVMHCAWSVLKDSATHPQGFCSETNGERKLKWDQLSQICLENAQWNQVRGGLVVYIWNIENVAA